MNTPERGLKPGHETRLAAPNADEVHPAEPSGQQSTEPRAIESPLESNSADVASVDAGKMANEAASRDENPLAGHAGETDPGVSRETVNSTGQVRVGPDRNGIDDLVQYRTLEDSEKALNELKKSEADLRTRIRIRSHSEWRYRN